MRAIATLVIAVIFINAVVFPNAQQMLHYAFLVIGAFMALIYRRSVPASVLILILASCSVTLLYLIIGAFRGATTESAMQTIIIYIISPMLWILVIDLAWQLLGTEKVIRGLASLALAGSASVAVYIYLFLNFGPQSVAFFGSNANVHLEDGYSGIAMHVLGSLIFLCAAFAAEPNATQTRFFGLSVLFSLGLATIASGRTMAVVGIAIGFLFLAVIAFRQIQWHLLRWVFVIIPAGLLVALSLNFILGVDVAQALGRHLDKMQGGDIERPAQIFALMKGMEDTWFLGAGHGIGVEYIRSDTFPWRYEAVFVALIYKVGFIGSLIVLFPIIFALGVFLNALTFGTARRYDGFFGAALVASFAAGFTNPYPEAFAFQWMYILPTYYFLSVRPINRLSRGVSAAKDEPFRRNLVD